VCKSGKAAAPWNSGELRMNGYFRMDFAGQALASPGGIALAGGRVAGVDPKGRVYRGTYVGSDAGVTGSLEVSMPEGGRLATGEAVPPGMKFAVPFSVIPDDGAGAVLHLQTRAPLSARLTKIADL
jgi:hypothetical protein